MTGVFAGCFVKGGANAGKIKDHHGFAVTAHRPEG